MVEVLRLRWSIKIGGQDRRSWGGLDVVGVGVGAAAQLQLAEKGEGVS